MLRTRRRYEKLRPDLSKKPSTDAGHSMLCPYEAVRDYAGAPSSGTSRGVADRKAKAGCRAEARRYEGKRGNGNGAAQKENPPGGRRPLRLTANTSGRRRRIKKSRRDARATKPRTPSQTAEAKALGVGGLCLFRVVEFGVPVGAARGVRSSMFHSGQSKSRPRSLTPEASLGCAL